MHTSEQTDLYGLPRPREGIWLCPSKKLAGGRLEGYVIQGMDANVQSHVHVVYGYSQKFKVTVCVNCGSVLSQLPFIIMLDALSREFRSGVPWKALSPNQLICRRLLIYTQIQK